MAVCFVLLTIAATVNGGGGARHQDNLPRTHGGHLSGGAGSADGGGGGSSIVEREGEGRDGSALCRPPAQPVSVDDADWCACFEGLMCEGSDCDVDMWDPEEVIYIFNLFIFIFISMQKKAQYHVLPSPFKVAYKRAHSSQCGATIAARTSSKFVRLSVRHFQFSLYVDTNSPPHFYFLFFMNIYIRSETTLIPYMPYLTLSVSSL